MLLGKRNVVVSLGLEVALNVVVLDQVVSQVRVGPARVDFVGGPLVVVTDQRGVLVLAGLEVALDDSVVNQVLSQVTVFPRAEHSVGARVVVVLGQCELEAVARKVSTDPSIYLRATHVFVSGLLAGRLDDSLVDEPVVLNRMRRS